MTLKFGIKIVVSDNLQQTYNAIQAVNNSIFQYIEILVPVEYYNSGLINKIKKTDVIQHIPHENYGVDIGIPEKNNFTIDAIKRNLNMHKIIDSKYIILHCGTGNLNNARKILKQFKDFNDIIVLENMPVLGANGEKCLGYDVESFLSLNKYDFGLCLDVGHAMKASISLRRSYVDVLSEFAELSPKIFHISDGKFDKEIDEHLNIGEGEYDFKFISKIIKDSSTDLITLETPRTSQVDIDEDIKNLKKLKSILSNILS